MGGVEAFFHVYFYRIKGISSYIRNDSSDIYSNPLYYVIIFFFILVAYMNCQLTFR